MTFLLKQDSSVESQPAVQQGLAVACSLIQV